MATTKVKNIRTYLATCKHTQNLVQFLTCIRNCSPLSIQHRGYSEGHLHSLHLPRSQLLSCSLACYSQLPAHFNKCMWTSAIIAVGKEVGDSMPEYATCGYLIQALVCRSNRFLMQLSLYQENSFTCTAANDT